MKKDYRKKYNGRYVVPDRVINASYSKAFANMSAFKALFVARN